MKVKAKALKLNFEVVMQETCRIWPNVLRVGAPSYLAFKVFSDCPFELKRISCKLELFQPAINYFGYEEAAFVKNHAGNRSLMGFKLIQ